MRLVVDGFIFEAQVRGGINRLFCEVLPRLCEMEPDLDVEFRTRPDHVVAVRLPRHARIRHVAGPDPQRALHRWLRPNRVFAPLIPALVPAARRLRPERARGRIWAPSHYTPAPLGWGGPRTSWVHDLIEEWEPEKNRAFLARKRRALVEADALLCNSRATTDAVAERYGVARERLHVAHLAPSPDFRRLAPEGVRPAGGGQPYVLYVGFRTAAHKGFDVLLDAYARWPGRRDVDLAVAGAPWTPAEREAIATRGLGADKAGPAGGRVLGLTGLGDGALVRLYNGAEAFVYPSLAEGFGIPLLEALACGCPVVASRIPTTVEVAGELPHYAPPGDADGLAAALEAALAEGRGARRTEAGIAHAATFSWDRTARRSLEVYRQLA